MADIYDLKTRSLVMRAVRGTGTKPEIAVRRALFTLGYRYKVHTRDLPGRPDIVFHGRRKVIFVHGCFWHQHPGCPRAARPASNAAYWNRKLDSNLVRDSAVASRLHHLGWSVETVWECELAQMETVVARLAAFLGPPRHRP